MPMRQRGSGNGVLLVSVQTCQTLGRVQGTGIDRNIIGSGRRHTAARGLTIGPEACAQITARRLLPFMGLKRHSRASTGQQLAERRAIDLVGIAARPYAHDFVAFGGCEPVQSGKRQPCAPLP